MPTQSLTYKYNQTTFWASLESFAEDGKARFRISLELGGSFVIAQARWTTSEFPNIWVQAEKPGNTTFPHDMVQGN